MIALAFRDVWLFVMFFKFSNCGSCNFENLTIYHEMTIYHKMHSRSYDFLYLSHGRTYCVMSCGVAVYLTRKCTPFQCHYPIISPVRNSITNSVL